MNTQTIKDFETSVLIRLWFRMLWQKYDHGGISAWRSLRCDLLDCYLEFVPIPQLERGADGYYEGLEEEIKRRPKVVPETIILEHISTYGKDEIARAGLGALLRLEESVDADTAWENGYELERKRIRAVLECFVYIAVPDTLDIQEVAQRLLQRKSDIEFEESEFSLADPYPLDGP